MSSVSQLTSYRNVLIGEKSQTILFIYWSCITVVYFWAESFIWNAMLLYNALFLQGH